jgi:hypothetical protein
MEKVERYLEDYGNFLHDGTINEIRMPCSGGPLEIDVTLEDGSRWLMVFSGLMRICLENFQHQNVIDEVSTSQESLVIDGLMARPVSGTLVTIDSNVGIHGEVFCGEAKFYEMIP